MTEPTAQPGLVGPVGVVGTGLLGTSVGLACRRAGLEVVLSDASPAHERTASALGAGRPWRPEDDPQIVVVAVPPDHLAEAIASTLRRTTGVVTDVGSVKSGPLTQLSALVAEEDLVRYVGSHPMAGSERSGPLAGSHALFDGRPWAIAPHSGNAPEDIDLVESLAHTCGAIPTRLSPEDHDQAVARISHLPHLASVLVAGRLHDAPTEHLSLSGQGVRDVTRIAASDPRLWQQILGANAEAVLALLDDLADALTDLREAVRQAAEGEPTHLAKILEQGVRGTQAIPGKHGAPVRPVGSVFVSIPDEPGSLARLFADAGASGVNIEDVRIDHDTGRPMGLTELVVAEESADHLARSLESRGWATHR